MAEEQEGNHDKCWLADITNGKQRAGCHSNAHQQLAITLTFRAQPFRSLPMFLPLCIDFSTLDSVLCCAVLVEMPPLLPPSIRSIELSELQIYTRLILQQPLPNKLHCHETNIHLTDIQWAFSNEHLRHCCRKCRYENRKAMRKKCCASVTF